MLKEIEKAFSLVCRPKTTNGACMIGARMIWARMIGAGGPYPHLLNISLEDCLGLLRLASLYDSS